MRICDSNNRQIILNKGIYETVIKKEAIISTHAKPTTERELIDL